MMTILSLPLPTEREREKRKAGRGLPNVRSQIVGKKVEKINDDDATNDEAR